MHAQAEEQREGHGGKDDQVPRARIEKRVLLEDGPAARARCEEVEPLHDDEVEEVDALRRADRLGKHVGVDVVVAVLEPQRRERDPLALERKVERADARRERLEQAEEAVRVQE